MRILYLITGLTLGGAEIISIDIANGMSARGHSVCIVHLSDKNELQSRINENIKVISLNMGKTPLSFCSSIIKFGQTLKQFKPNVVHANMVHANIFARISRIFYKMPRLICSAHSNNEGGILRMLSYRMTDFLSDTNTNVSEEAVNHYTNNGWFSKEKSICVYNGINDNIFRPDEQFRNLMRSEYGIKPNEFIFLFIGRLTKIKDVPTILKAFQSVSNNIRGVKLLIVGDGEEMPSLQEETKKLKINDITIFAGKQNDTWKYYNAADCFILSSAWEGFGIVLVEAMSCGLPVLATNAGGCSEVINDNRFLVEVGNHKELSKKMISIYRLDSITLSLLKERNIKRAKTFALSNILDKWEEIYQDN
ncbi:MAG: glycosyltransferase [Prevotellaceae bacterium]|nr:glycosyltransferase [Prevotellaceae bacterium]